MRGRQGEAASVDLPADTLSLLYRILNTPNFHNLTFTNQLSNSAKRHSPCPLFLPSPLSFPHVHGIRMSSSTISTPPRLHSFPHYHPPRRSPSKNTAREEQKKNVRNLIPGAAGHNISVRQEGPRGWPRA